MRWIVEVISIGKTDKQSYCVESDSWQRALQSARGLRNDHAPMTGFSIELLDEGFSAVDPMSRLRYFVKRAADDAPLTAPAAATATAPAPAPARGAAHPASSPQQAAAAAPRSPAAGVPSPLGGVSAASPAQAAQPAAKAADGKKPLQKTVVFSSQGAAMVPEAAATTRDMGEAQPSASASRRPSPAASPPQAGVASAQAHGPTAPRPAATSSPPGAPLPVHPAKPQQGAQLAAASAQSPVASSSPAASAPLPAAASPIVPPPTLPGIEVLFKREQEPDNRSPLTYREYVYFFAAGREETMARAMLFAQFELVKASIAGAKPGKLVNLAMFDVAFKGKAPAPPVVTLTWKDWKGDPVIEFPRRNLKNGPSASVPHAPVPAAQSGAASSSSAQASPPKGPTQAPQHALPQTAAVAAAAGGAAAGVPMPVPAGHTTQPSAGQPSAGAVAFMPAQPAAAPVPQAFPPVHPSLTPSHGVRRAPSKPTLGRLRGDELIADLFEAMHDLHFLRDAVEGADFCLSLALEKMPSRAGIVHLYDIDKREFVVTCARGAGVEQLLLRRFPEADPLLSAAMRKQRAIVIADATNGDAASAERYQAMGGAKSVIVAPVILAGRFLGGVELLNPSDGNPFTEDEGHAMTYIGEQFAEFVATRGVTLDPERIMMKQSAPPRMR